MARDSDVCWHHQGRISLELSDDNRQRCLAAEGEQVTPQPGSSQHGLKVPGQTSAEAIGVAATGTGLSITDRVDIVILDL